MLRCMDDTIYTGITADINRRMEEHFTKDKKSAKYVRSHTAKQAEAVWQCEGRAIASKLEYEIKKLSRDKKEKLIEENNLSMLSNRIDRSIYERIEINQSFKITG